MTGAGMGICGHDRAFDAAGERSSIGSSPLELLHPDGIARRALVMGHGCPPGLLPHSYPVPAEERVDLAIVAPDENELDRGWIARACMEVAERLDNDGVAYVMAPRRVRQRMSVLLRERGLSVGPWLMHAPSYAMTRHLFPLAETPARYALLQLIPARRWKRRIASLLVGFRLFRRFARAVGGVGLVARPCEARPLFEWLYRLDGSEGPGWVITTTSWRGREGAIVLHRLPEHGPGRPVLAKVSAPSGRAHEGHVLEELGPSARLAGARIPVPLASSSLRGSPVLLQTALYGQRLVDLLAEEPARLPEVVNLVSDWLERWHHLTCVPCHLTAELLDRELLEPARLLGPYLEQGAGYLVVLERLCTANEAMTISLVAAHNDLTMANIVLDDSAGLGVFDWESARTGCLPLKDFFYAAVDAVAAVDRYAGRPQAFWDCFSVDGRFTDAVAWQCARLIESLKLSRTAVEISFHACWLHHAANEHRSSVGSDPRPFLEIVRRLAREPSLVPHGE